MILYLSDAAQRAIKAAEKRVRTERTQDALLAYWKRQQHFYRICDRQARGL